MREWNNFPLSFPFCFVLHLLLLAPFPRVDFEEKQGEEKLIAENKYRRNLQQAIRNRIRNRKCLNGHRA